MLKKNTFYQTWVMEGREDKHIFFSGRTTKVWYPPPPLELCGPKPIARDVLRYSVSNYNRQIILGLASNSLEAET